jgi:hypothetical protein
MLAIPTAGSLRQDWRIRKNKILNQMHLLTERTEKSDSMENIEIFSAFSSEQRTGAR